MRAFYLNYFERTSLLPKLRTIPWNCHVTILDKCKDPLQQEFYLELCNKEGLKKEGLLAALKEQRYEKSSFSSLIPG
jgi:hypothetical protein